jgi:hypothetical protein
VFGAKMVHESQGTAPNFVHDLIAEQIGQPKESGAIQTFCYRWIEESGHFACKHELIGWNGHSDPGISNKDIKLY